MDIDKRLNRSLRTALLREAVRRRQQRKFVEAVRKPQEGPYYWIPLPGGNWELMSWFVDELGQDNTDHVRIWRLSGAPYMAERWGIDPTKLERLPYAVPRGRVSKGYGTIYINHGADAPVPHDEMVRRVCREFNLTGVLLRNPEKIKAAVDNHERMSKREQAELRTLLSGARIAV